MSYNSAFDEAMACPFVNESQKTRRWIMNVISSKSAHSISSLFGKNNCSDADLELLPCFASCDHELVTITKDDTEFSDLPREVNLMCENIGVKMDNLIMQPIPYINQGMLLRLITGIKGK
jgi:hypothetical protein